MTSLYGAFTETDTPFASLEEAVQTVTSLPWMGERTVRSISMVTQQDGAGIQAEVVSGTAHPDQPDTLTYLVDVEHIVGGVTIPIKYLIEFGANEDGETGEDSGGLEPRDEEASQELDRSPEQGGEGDGDVPPAGDADYSDEYYEHN